MQSKDGPASHCLCEQKVLEGFYPWKWWIYSHSEAWMCISFIKWSPGKPCGSLQGVDFSKTYQRKGEPIGRRDHMVPKVPVGVNFLDMLFLTTLTPTLSLDPVFLWGLFLLESLSFNMLFSWDGCSGWSLSLDKLTNKQKAFRKETSTELAGERVVTRQSPTQISRRFSTHRWRFACPKCKFFLCIWHFRSRPRYYIYTSL